MEKVHIGNRDVITLDEFRLKCCVNDVPGIVVDDDGVEYGYNRYGVCVDSPKEHPAHVLTYELSAEIITKALEKRQKEVNLKPGERKPGDLLRLQLQHDLLVPK